MLHDENYKRLFASPLMVQDVLRACLPAHRLAAADLSSLGELSAEYVSDELRTRHGDTVWHLRLGRRRAFLLVLLEFQAQDDRLMALRILTYTGLLLLELARNQPPEVAGERLPAVLPVVLYNGTEPWTAAPDMGSLITPVGPWLAPYQPAQRYYLIDLQRVAADDLPYRNLLRAVARLEQSRSPEDVMRAVKALRRWLPKRGAEELRRAFVDWLCQIAGPLAPPGALVPAIRTLEEASMTLVERVAEWPKQWLREGHEQGVAEGREHRALRKVVNKVLRKVVNRALPRVSTSNGHCCVGWRRRASMPTPVPAWPTCWHRSPIRNGWPRSVTGWCAARPPPRSSPASIPPHHPDTCTPVVGETVRKSLSCGRCTPWAIEH